MSHDDQAKPDERDGPDERDERDDGPPPKKGMPAWVIILIVCSICLVMVPCVAVVAAIAIPNLLASKTAANQVATVQNLKALSTAQAQFIKLNDYYAADARSLNGQVTLVSPDLANAFQAHLGNGDLTTPVPKAGYVYRMLLGDASNTTAYVTGTAPSGEMQLNTWGATSRPALPGTSGDSQFYITEMGVVFETDDPGTNQFLLAAVPDPSTAGNWTPAR